MTELENRIIVELSKKVVDNIARKYERKSNRDRNEEDV